MFQLITGRIIRLASPPARLKQRTVGTIWSSPGAGAFRGMPSAISRGDNIKYDVDVRGCGLYQWADRLSDEWRCVG